MNVLYIEWDSQVGTWRSWESFPCSSTRYWSSLCLCIVRSHCMLVELRKDLKGVRLCMSLACFQPASETAYCICPPQHSFLSGWQMLSCGLLGVSARGQTALPLAQILDLGKHVSSWFSHQPHQIVVNLGSPVITKWSGFFMGLLGQWSRGHHTLSSTNCVLWKWLLRFVIYVSLNKDIAQVWIRKVYPIDLNFNLGLFQYV